MLFGLLVVANASEKVGSNRPLLPLRFEPNLGQAPQKVSKIGHSGSTTLGFDRTGFTVGRPSTPLIRFNFQNASAEPELQERTLGVVNYLRGNDSANWIKQVPTYEKLTYRSLYPGVDLVFYGNEQRFEHDFVVASGADYKAIRLRIQSGTEVRLAKEGDLEIGGREDGFRLRRPEAYQIVNGERHSVPARFVVAGNEISFAVEKYDRTEVLYIDPVIVFSTFYGSGIQDSVTGVALDTVSGNSYVTGVTFSAAFPTANPTQPNCGGCPNNPDVFIAEISADGTQLLFATYLGGSQQEQPTSIAVHSNIGVAIGGWTWSTDFPTTSPMFTAPSFGTRGFVTSISQNGGMINFSSLVPDTVSAVAFDDGGALYIAGTTATPDFPKTPGTLPGDPPAYPNYDIFAAKIYPDAQLAYSAVIPHRANTSPFGASGSVTAMKVDDNQNVYIAGNYYDGLPTTPGALQTSHQGDSEFDGFVVKLNSDASALLSATYLGGSSDDRIAGLAISPVDSNVVVVGSTSSADFPTIADSFHFPDTSFSFVAKLSNDLSQLLGSTKLGCSPSCPAFGASVDAWATTVAQDGRIYVAGIARNANIPQIHPIQTRLSDDPFTASGGMLMGFSGDLKNLEFSTFLQGTGTAQPVSIAHANGFLYVTGKAFSADFPITLGALNSTFPIPPPSVQASAAFLTKLDVDGASPAICAASGSISITSPVGQTATRTLTLTNCGDSDLQVSSVTMDTGTRFSQTNNCTLGPVAPQQSCSIQVTFSSPQRGSFKDAVTVTSNAPIPTFPVRLQGFATQGVINAFAGNSIPDALVGSSTSTKVWIDNVGDASLHITGVAVSGAGFSIPREDCTLQAVPPDQFHACTIDLTFAPTAAGPSTATVTITGDAENAPYTLNITANGFASAPTPQISQLTNSFLRAGTSSADVFVSGSGFFPETQVLIDGVPHATVFNGNGSLILTLSQAEIGSSIGEKKITVVNPSPGGASNAKYLTIYAGIKASAADLTYDPYSRRLLATSPTGAAANQDSLLFIDPAKLAVESATALGAGSSPRKLAVSADGRYAYIGLDGQHQVARVRMADRSKEFSVALGTEHTYNSALTARDIKVVPTDPTAIVVSLLAPSVSPGESGVAYIKGSQLKNRILNEFSDGYVSVDGLVLPLISLGDGSSIFGNDNSTFSTFKINGDAIARTSSVSTGAIVYGTLVTDGQSIFSTNGYKLDIAHPSVPFGRLPNQFFGDLVLEKESSRGFGMSGNTAINVYDTSTLQQVDQLGISSINAFPSRLVRWGTDGFAFTTYFGSAGPNDEVIVFRSLMARPYPASSVAPALTALSPSSKPAGSGNFDLTITGTNFARGAVVTLNGTVVERVYEDGDAASGVWLTAKIGAAELAKPGPVTVRVTNPGGLQSNAVTFRVLSRSTGVDFNGDGKADITAWRPSTGFWYSIPADAPMIAQQWGNPTDIPVPADYDGDGKTDIAVWRPSSGYWYVMPSSNPSAVIAQQWGATLGSVPDIPMPGDYDGDGKTDFAVWRPTTGFWYVLRSSDSTVVEQQWGGTFGGIQDVPVAGDFDGDGKADFAVWRPSSGFWYVLKSTDSSMVAQQWGATLGGVQDVPVPADFDGDGKTDVAVWRPSSGVWYVILSGTGNPVSQQWGGTIGGVKDVPLIGDFDGDGTSDYAVWRPSDGKWYVLPSATPGTFTSTQWGFSTDKPISLKR